MNILLETLKACVNNKEAYFKVVKTKKSGNKLIVSKYENLPYYEIVLTEDNSNHIIKTYNKLSAYDCYDLIINLKES